MAYIETKDLEVGYEGNTVAAGINFKVEKGDYVCVLGENGGGKSTLMKTLLHLRSQVSGEIKYGDGLLPYEIGYLPQMTQLQRDFPASVREIVLSGNVGNSKSRFFYGNEEKKRAASNMKKMDVWGLRKKCYRNLSGGQQQRVLLARALCATSRLILLDEPVTGLDPKATVDFYNTIEALNKEGVSIIMITHDFEAAMKYSSHILHLNRTQLFFGTVSEYKRSRAYKAFDEEKYEVSKENTQAEERIEGEAASE